MINLSAFKAYDVRGRIPDELNPDLVYQIGRAYAAFREAEEGLRRAATSGSPASEFAQAADPRPHRRRRRRARHRPVRHRRRVLRHLPLQARRRRDGHRQPQSARLQRPQAGARAEQAHRLGHRAQGHRRDDRRAANYRRRRPPRARSTKLDTQRRLHRAPAGLREPQGAAQAQGGRGCGQRRRRADGRQARAAPAVRVHQGAARARRHFPQGVPNPMLEENRGPTLEALRKSGADVGIAWDGDYDRCFFYDSKGVVHRGLLHRRPAGRELPRQTTRRAHRLRPAAHLEHHRHREAPGRRAGDEQVRSRLHQAEDARSGRRLWRRDERASLFPRLLVLRQRHDSLAAGARARVRIGQVAGRAGRGAHQGVSGERRDQPQAAGREEGAGRGRGEVRQGRRHRRSHRRPVRGVQGLALQPARVQHGTAGAPQCRIPRRRVADAREDRRAAGLPRLAGRRETRLTNGVNSDAAKGRSS